LEGKPTICGGTFRNHGMPATDRCYQLNEDGFMLFAQMRKKRFSASSVVYNNTIWITGGNDDYGHLSETSFNSTEYILPNG